MRSAPLFAASALAFALSPAAPPARSVPACKTSQLRIRLVRSAVAAGTVGGYIGFTNRARTPCRLTGWPTLVALGRAGPSPPGRHVRSTMLGPRPTLRGVPVVILGRGERADAVFAAGDSPRPGASRCAPPYRFLRVTPPGNRRSGRISAWLPSYGQYLPSCTSIEISMVVPNSALYRG